MYTSRSIATRTSQSRHSDVGLPKHDFTMETPVNMPTTLGNKINQKVPRFTHHRFFQSATQSPTQRRSKSLPSIGTVASSMCSHRGCDVSIHGRVPEGSSILVVDTLSFDKATILLSVVENARVFAQDIQSTKSSHSLALRVAGEVVTTELILTLVSDLAHDRTVIMANSLYLQICTSRTPNCAVRQVRVSADADGNASVWIDPMH